jgi:CBS domain-containing protein
LLEVGLVEFKDVLEEPIIVNPEETVTKVASKLLSAGGREALVMDKGNFLGIVLARDLVKVRISDPHKTKIGGYARDVNPLVPGASINQLVNAFLVNGYRAVPVRVDSRIMVLTRMGLLGLIRNEPVIKSKTAQDVMNFPYAIDEGDPLSTTRNIIKDMNISRLPVVKEGKVLGLVNVVDLLAPIVKGDSEKRSEPFEDNVRIDEIPASSFMRKDVPRVKASAPVTEIIDLIVKSRSAVIVEDDVGVLAGIVTPGDILKLMGRELTGTYVTISGMRDEDEFIKNVIYDNIEEVLKKIDKFSPVNYFVAHMEKYHGEDGGRAKYSFRAKLATSGGFFFAKDHDWDATKAMKGVLEKLEKEVVKRKERFGR